MHLYNYFHRLWRPPITFFWVTDLELGWEQGVAPGLLFSHFRLPTLSFQRVLCVGYRGGSRDGGQVQRITDNPVITFEIAFQINSHSFPTLQRKEDQGRINSYEKNEEEKTPLTTPGNGRYLFVPVSHSPPPPPYPVAYLCFPSIIHNDFLILY